MQTTLLSERQAIIRLTGLRGRIALALAALALCTMGTAQDSSTTSAPGASGLVDVMSYGAAGDGVTDDRPSIQAALNAAADGCKTVWFAPGKTFLVASHPNAGQPYNYVMVRPPCVSLDGQGTIRIADHMDFYFLLHTDNETGASIRNITIDSNGEGNPINAALNYVQGPFGNSLIDVQSGANLTVDHVTFINGNGVWAVSANVVNNVNITNSQFLNWGVGGSFRHDTSALYINGDGKLIAGNAFNSHGLMNVTAIEVHGSHSRVQGNNVYGFGVGIIYSVDTATGGVGRDNIISGNTIYSANRGIVLASEDGIIDGLKISGNAILLDRNLADRGTGWPVLGAEGGIQWTCLSTFPVQNVAITDNAIEFMPENSLYPVQQLLSGISVANCANPQSPDVSNVEIAGNSVTNSPASGIYWNANHGTATNVSIHDNIVRNTGQEASASNYWHAGLLITGTRRFANFSVANNQIVDDQESPTTAQAVMWFGVPGDDAPTQAKSMHNSLILNQDDRAIHWVYDTSAPYIDEDIPAFNLYTAGYVFSGMYGTGQYPPQSSTIRNRNTGIAWVNSNRDGFTWRRASIR